MPEQYTGVTQGKVEIRKHVIIGSGSIILPRITIGEGSSVGALSLVTKSIDEWGVYFGIPVKKLKNRLKDVLKLESELIEKLK